MCFSYKKSYYSMNKKKSLLKWDREMEFVIVEKEFQRDLHLLLTKLL